MSGLLSPFGWCVLSIGVLSLLVFAGAAQAQDAANAVSNKYNARIVTVNSLYSAKIANVKARASADIKQAKAAYKRLYRDAISATKELRTNEFELVTSLRDRGAGYIDQMPLPPAAM